MSPFHSIIKLYHCLILIRGVIVTVVVGVDPEDVSQIPVRNIKSILMLISKGMFLRILH